MSEPEVVNPVPVEAIEPWMRTLRTALLHDPGAPDALTRLHNRRRTWTPERTWGVRHDDRWVGTLATEARTLTVPGSPDVVAVDALTAVSVAATHRRRGFLRGMLGRSLAAAAERGDALSVLIAAEWPIYGRFGYAPATQSARYRYHPRRPGALPRGGDAHRIRAVTADEVGEIGPVVFDRARRRDAGQMDRDGAWWPRSLGLGGFELQGERQHWFVHDGDDGAPDGLLAWRPTRSLDLDGTPGAVAVQLLAAATDAAYLNLWTYLAGIDLVGEITLDERPVDEPVRWLLGDGRALQETGTVDELWVRLLDVPAALTARGYAADGRIVLDVRDEDTGGYAAGRFALDVAGGVARCEPTADGADLLVAQRALASAYLGGHRLRRLAVAAGVEERTPGALDRADLMFSTPVAPWNQTHF
ncbi:Predicted acetyltransferase [Jatrophihabitans endophyticus]|uniref:Predicted acetyltransferase n=1 Tax=Jatrophihabitans endophyticus TaxID=1206085 RepID=A0A1M5BVN4_9ACTN|nr:GNAT family N-acetyltransferase [Jatrophihabitans endophyticus]SHF46292.1 Predicted acetyltransferase [Jatrophihabitans endophyticus]